jgi:hypothetical protein
MICELPPKPILEHLKSQAKDLLDAHRRGEPEAFARIRAAVPAFAHKSTRQSRAGRSRCTMRSRRSRVSTAAPAGPTCAPRSPRPAAPSRSPARRYRSRPLSGRTLPPEIEATRGDGAVRHAERRADAGARPGVSGAQCGGVPRHRDASRHLAPVVAARSTPRCTASRTCSLCSRSARSISSGPRDRTRTRQAVCTSSASSIAGTMAGGPGRAAPVARAAGQKAENWAIRGRQRTARKIGNTQMSGSGS